MSTFLLSSLSTFSAFYFVVWIIIRIFAVYYLLKPIIVGKDHTKIVIYATTEEYSQEVS